MTRTATSTRTREPSARTGAQRHSDRFAGRRMAEERRQGLRRLRLVLGLTFVTSLAVGIIGFLNSSSFDVDEVVVSGNERADAAMITQASGIELGQALLEVDLAGAVSNVELVPWVGTAEVIREWNGSIEIVVTERGPSAVINAGPSFALIDEHGRQLEIVDRRPEGFVPVLGIEGSGVAGEAAPDASLPIVALLEAMPVEVEDQIDAVALENGNLFLDLSVGGRANFGGGTDLGPKLQALETMLATVDMTCVQSVDLRVPSAPALTRNSSAVQATAEGNISTTESDGQAGGIEEPDSGHLDC